MADARRRTISKPVVRRDGNGDRRVVFTTGHDGLSETLTDPSYHDRLRSRPSAHRQYGTNDDDVESDHIYMKDTLCANGAFASNFRAKDASTLFEAHGTIGLFDIDTRALTRRLREHAS
jgi:carbamoyl-phosphate synthase small subunit